MNMVMPLLTKMIPFCSAFILGRGKVVQRILTLPDIDFVSAGDAIGALQGSV